ncbi:hypothetical protein N1851_007719 [Merluccius polli]|uniref:Uncharacterized protein n=1 Tax=Merluccius polli TaxID=89951 RepID=A0AA47P7L9_MERPO|nr:hypothetical protein N1851_007719 [Merluccius polli]
MDRYRYFVFNQRNVVVLGVLQVACAGLCMVCGVIDAAFRKDTTLSITRAPIWGGMILASPGTFALCASQRKHPVLVSAMVIAAMVAWVAAVTVSAYSCLTLTYGQEDVDVFHQHSSAKVTFILQRTVKGANGTILLSCVLSLFLSTLVAYMGCRSLPFLACYDARTGLETLVPQSDPCLETELVCTWQAEVTTHILISKAIALSNCCRPSPWHRPFPYPVPDGWLSINGFWDFNLCVTVMKMASTWSLLEQLPPPPCELGLLADVSKSGMEWESANCCATSVLTWTDSRRSHLLPTKIRGTSVPRECCLHSSIQAGRLRKLVALVTSYTKTTACTLR